MASTIAAVGAPAASRAKHSSTAIAAVSSVVASMARPTARPWASGRPRCRSAAVMRGSSGRVTATTRAIAGRTTGEPLKTRSAAPALTSTTAIDGTMRAAARTLITMPRPGRRVMSRLTASTSIVAVERATHPLRSTTTSPTAIAKGTEATTSTVIQRAASTRRRKVAAMAPSSPTVAVRLSRAGPSTDASDRAEETSTSA